MIATVLYAVPVFLLLLILEVMSYHFLPDDERGYEARDTATSLSMGIGSLRGATDRQWKRPS
ncbi:hypothetical protein [Kitasatospora acidiphila]|uniref:hypothetical protein n=1 Tax=Kitasatospora acidiphila TaxID=2567942 RepID=UPI001C666BEC|nr:hypothetical protein [Kitasatospora acidiphila]